MKKRSNNIRSGYSHSIGIIIILVITGLNLFCFDGLSTPLKKQVTIHGQVNGSNASKVYHTIPVNGKCYLGFGDTLKIDPSGKFHFEFKTADPVFLRTTVNGKTISLIAEPGNSFFLKYDFSGNSKKIEIEGPNKAGQLLLNKIPKPITLREVNSTKFLDTLGIKGVKNEIKKRKEKEFLKYNRLYSEGKISKVFREFAKNNQNLYYISLKATWVWRKFLRTDPQKLDTFPAKFKKYWGNIYKNPPVSNDALFSSLWWYDYATIFLNHQEYMADDFRVEKLKKIHERGEIHTHNLNIARQYFDGKFLEYYEARYLYQAAIQDQYQKELITLINNFQNTFPESPFTKFLEPWNRKILAFHDTLKEEFQIDYIENYDTLNSLQDCISLIGDTPLFIHIWASWCGPCIEEFDHNSTLNKVLQDQGFQHLYISIDEARDKDKWKKMIKGFKLKGKHLRANKNLNADLRKIFNRGGRIVIPWYMIVNSQGEIAIKHAHKPSQLSLLENQLKKVK